MAVEAEILSTGNFPYQAFLNISAVISALSFTTNSGHRRDACATFEQESIRTKKQRILLFPLSMLLITLYCI